MVAGLGRTVFFSKLEYIDTINVVHVKSFFMNNGHWTNVKFSCFDECLCRCFFFLFSMQLLIKKMDVVLNQVLVLCVAFEFFKNINSHPRHEHLVFVLSLNAKGKFITAYIEGDAEEDCPRNGQISFKLNE